MRGRNAGPTSCAKRTSVTKVATASRTKRQRMTRRPDGPPSPSLEAAGDEETEGGGEERDGEDGGASVGLLLELRVELALLDGQGDLARVAALDVDAHGDAGADDLLDAGLQGAAEHVLALHGRDLDGLLDGQVADEGVLRAARALLDLGLLDDELRDRRRADLDGGLLLVVDDDLDGDLHPHVGLRRLVDLGDDLAHVRARGAQDRAQGAGGDLAAVDDRLDGLCHVCLPRPVPAGAGRRPFLVVTAGGGAQGWRSGRAEARPYMKSTPRRASGARGLVRLRLRGRGHDADGRAGVGEKWADSTSRNTRAFWRPEGNCRTVSHRGHWRSAMGRSRPDIRVHPDICTPETGRPGPRGGVRRPGRSAAARRTRRRGRCGRRGPAPPRPGGGGGSG